MIGSVGDRLWKKWSLRWTEFKRPTTLSEVFSYQEVVYAWVLNVALSQRHVSVGPPIK
jgi:hypothetical protein